MKRLAILFPILLLALGTGCLLVSGQITVVQEFVDDNVTAGANVYPLHVDLNDNSDYEEHGDKIKSLEAFGFVVRVWNQGNMEARGEGYIVIGEDIDPQLNSRAALVASSKATRILNVHDPIAPGGYLDITFEMSQDYIENFDTIEDAILDGEISFYGVTDIGQTVKYEDLKLIATINASL